jgi:ABC-type glycerol-3-phosphate transport system substrate-binding protein
MQGAADGWLYYELSNYLFSMGTGTSKKDFGWQETNDITIDSPQNQEVLRYYKKLLATSSGNFFNVGASQQQAIMLEGKTAMAIVWSDYVQPLAASKSPRFGFAPIPGPISGLAGGAFYINRRSQHLHAAAQFVLYALSPENQTQLIEKGLCSPLKTAYTEDVMSRVPYARALRDSLKRGVFMFEAGSDSTIVSDALTTWVQSYVRGNVSEVEALKQAQAEVVRKRAGHR